MRSGQAIVVALALLGWIAALSGHAQAPPERVRGILEAVEGDQLSVETRDGETVELRLKEGAGVFVVTPAALEDIEAGDFVGITSIEAGGRRVALEAHLFAEDLRGVGEGHYPWDLVQEPNMMTNATIAEIKDVGEDRRLQVTYAEGEGDQTREAAQTIFVPPDVPVVLMKQSTDQALEPGKPVFLMVEPSAAGPEAVAVAVGEGVAPPM